MTQIGRAYLCGTFNYSRREHPLYLKLRKLWREPES